MLKINEAVEIKALLLNGTGQPTSGSIDFTVYDETDTQFSSGTMDPVGGVTGLYTLSFTPDTAGEWTVKISCSDPVRNAAKVFEVGRGVETDIHNVVKAGGSGDCAAILADTNELQTDWVDGGRLDNLIDGIKAKTDNLPASPAPASEYDTQLGTTERASASALSTHDTDIKNYVDKIDDSVDGLTAIKAEVEGLAGEAMRGTDNAALASVCTELRLAELDSTNLPTDVDTLLARLTATRAGYLDNLSEGAVATASSLSTHDTDIKNYVDKIDDATDGLTAIKAEVEGLGGAAMRGTDNAALATVCTETRLSELDSTNLPTDIDLIKGDTPYIHDQAIGTPTAYSVAEILFISSTEKIKDFIAKTGGSPLPASKSLYDVIALDRLDDSTYGLSALNTDLDTLLGRLTATRAGYLDNLSAGAVALASVCTSARLSELDASNIPADIDIIKADTPMIADATLPASPVAGSLARFIASGGTALGTQLPDSKSLYDVLALDRWDVRLSSTRAAKIDNLDTTVSSRSSHSATDVRQSVTLGTDPVDSIGRRIYDNLNAAVGSIPTNPTLQTVWTDAKAGYLDAAISSRSSHAAADIWSVTTRALTDKAGFYIAGTKTTLDALNDLAQSDILSDATAFAGANIGAIKAKTDNLPTDPASESGAIKTDTAAILTDTSDMQPRVPRIVSHMDFWSDNDDEISISTTSSNINLPNIVVAGLPSGITVIRVVALLKIALIKDTSAADNAVNGTTMALKVDSASDYSSTVTAIDIPDNSWAVDVSEGTERGGDVMIGDNDVKTEVTGNATFYGRFENAVCDGNNLKLKDIAWGIRVYFTV